MDLSAHPNFEEGQTLPVHFLILTSGPGRKKLSRLMNLNKDFIKVLSVAPMMDWTDRHYRYFARLLSKHATLYTEMIPAGAVLYGDRTRYLQWSSPYGLSKEQGDVVLQLGGADPDELAKAASYAEEYGYSEVNLNCGCPSDRVRDGSFGACLMAEPSRVKFMVEQMQKSTGLPVTVKHRTGIDGKETYEDLKTFVATVAEAGCSKFIVHARIAVLGGLSPAQNRTVPPLRYEDVYRLKQELPELTIEINGGIRNISEIYTHLKYADSVMVGREAYENPVFLAVAEQSLFTQGRPTGASVVSRKQILDRLIPYIDSERHNGTSVHHIIRHILNLMKGIRGAKRFRGVLSDAANRHLETEDLFALATEEISSDDLNRPVYKEPAVPV